MKEPAGTPDTSAGLSNDLTGREIGILTPIAICCVVLGVYPKPMQDTFEIAIRQHVLLKPATSMYASGDLPAVDADDDAHHALLYSPLSHPGLTAFRDTSNSQKPRGLKPAARNKETEISLATGDDEL